MKFKIVGRSCFLALMFVFVFGENSALGQDTTLNLVLDETEILRDGVVVGELVMTNTGSGSTRSYRGLSIKSGALVYVIERPDKTTRCTTFIPGVHVSRQELRLNPGDYVRKPICLLVQNGKYFFNIVGTYRIKAVYDDTETTESDWVEITVREGSDSREKYLASSRFLNLVDAHTRRKWALKESALISEYGDYTNEMAKLVIYQLGAVGVIGQIRSPKKGAVDVINHAQMSLSLAQKYGYGVKMWTTIENLISHPENVQVLDSGKFETRNSLYF